MTVYTLNSGGTVNFDTLTSPSVNATLDTYTISNRTTLKIDTDTFLCANRAAASGALDTVAFSGTGGVLHIDGTGVRIIPYNSGTGNVPAIGTTISLGGVSAYLLGVYESIGKNHTPSGSAMPTSGFIKVRGKTGGDFSAGALTGIGASATGADRVGWITVKGTETATITVPRVGQFKVTGEWFELGTTNGTANQELEFPMQVISNAGCAWGVWIETSPGSDVYEQYASRGQEGSGGPTDDFRGKFVAFTNDDGVTYKVAIGADAFDVTCGYLPPSGCKVRVPNVFLLNNTRTAGGVQATKIPNSTLVTRQGFVTTSAGDIRIDKANVGWYCNFQQPYNVQIHDSTIADTLVIAEQSTPLDIDNVIISPTQNQINVACSLTSNFGGGTVNDLFAVSLSIASSGRYIMLMNYNKNVAFDGLKLQAIANRGHAATGAMTSTKNSGCSFNDTSVIGGQILKNTDSGDQYTGFFKYADRHLIDTLTTFAMSIMAMTNCSNIDWSALFTIPVANTNPYTALFTSTAGSNMQFANIGTYASKVDLGNSAGATHTGLIFNSGGNNDNIRLKRVYTTDTRTGLWNFVNSDNNILLESVYGDYADTTQVSSLNTKVKGCGLTPAVTGQASVYGTHWQHCFTALTTGRLIASFNEPTVQTTGQAYDLVGTASFNSSGQIVLTAVNDSVTLETADYIGAVSSFAALIPTFTGTNSGNHLIEYQLNQGSGYSGSWRNAWKTKAATGGTSGTQNITVASTADITVNDYVYGTGVGTGAKVTGITNATTFTVSVNNSGTVSGTLTFSRLPDETIADPALGFKMKLKVTCTTASATNALTFFRMDFVTSDALQAANLYPINTADLVLTGLQSGSDIVILEPGTSTEYENVDSNAGSTYTFTYDAESVISVDIGVFKTGYVPWFIRGYGLTSAGASLPVTQIADRAYLV